MIREPCHPLAVGDDKKETCYYALDSPLAWLIG